MFPESMYLLLNNVCCFKDLLIHLDDKYIKHILQRNPLRKDEKIMKIYEKIALKLVFTFDMLKYEPADI